MLTRQQKRQLTGQASKLHPIILIGINGLTQAVHAEIERALYDHELVKIRFHDKDRQLQKQYADEICETHTAELVHRIGHIIVIYRERPDQDSKR